MNFKDKSVLVYDAGGLFISFAERLARDFGRVGYMVEWESGFADGRELLVGSGLAGVDRIRYFWPHLDKWDLFVFPDVWRSDLQEYLRSIGKRVWGTGTGSSLELARWYTHELLPILGLPQNNAQQVLGTDNLRAYLKTHKDQYVKLSTFRGIGETWHAEDYDMAKGQIDELDSIHGPLAQVLGFIVEEAIPDAIEVGYDGYYVNGFPNKAVWGLEAKDKGYLGKATAYDELPETVRKTNDALKKALSEHTYRQFFSTEIREKDGVGYLIDITARLASPAGEVYTEMFVNLAEILWEGAAGNLVEPQIEEPYGAQIILCSEWAEKHFEAIKFPEEIRPFVRLYNHCRINDIDYTVPQSALMKQVGSVVALGKTAEQAVALCKKRAEKVHGYDIESEADSLDKLLLDFKKL